MPVFQTAITGTPFNSGSTPTSYSGITISCLPYMFNTFYLNVYQTTSKTISVKSNVNWLHINATLNYVGTNYTSYLITYVNDYNSVVNGRTGTISITATGLSTTWTVNQNGITPDRMSETELSDLLVAILETQGG